jgi:esterase/lipase superfamily enzyme
MEPQLFTLLIANGRHSDPRVRDLSFPSNNLEALQKVLMSRRSLGFAELATLKDLDSRAIKYKIHDTLSQANQSEVLLYYSGRIAADQQGHLCLMARDTRLDHLPETSITTDWLSSVISTSGATAVGIILDTIYVPAVTPTFNLNQLPAFPKQVSIIGVIKRPGRATYDKGRLSAYTSLILRGVRNGTADVNGDGLITVDDLDDYAHRCRPSRAQRLLRRPTLSRPVIARTRSYKILPYLSVDFKIPVIGIFPGSGAAIGTVKGGPMGAAIGAATGRGMGAQTSHDNAPRAFQYISMSVLYATSRQPTGNTNPAAFYGFKRANEIQFGQCEVSIPIDHRTGRLEAPSILRFEFRKDPEKHVVLQHVRPCPAEQFLTDLNSSVAQSKRRDVLVFVHGFNVSFEDAARRTAQIAYDLDFVGAPIFYSWPSRGRLTLAGYRHDANNVKWAVPHLVTFLNEVSSRSGAETIHLIAHSMGNQALTDALSSIAGEFTERASPRFTEVVLTAPDIDADVFIDLAKSFRKAAKHTTLYASSNDLALGFSKKYQGNYHRAGDSEGQIVIVPGVDTIDVSHVDTNFIGHFYYGDNKSVLSDLYYLLTDGKPPGERFGLLPQKSDRGVYWLFRP